MAIAKGLLSEDDYLLQEILFNPRTPATEGEDKGGHGQGHAFDTGGKHSFKQHTSLLGFFMFLS